MLWTGKCYNYTQTNESVICSTCERKLFFHWVSLLSSADGELEVVFNSRSSLTSSYCASVFCCLWLHQSIYLKVHLKNEKPKKKKDKGMGLAMIITNKAGKFKKLKTPESNPFILPV